MRAHRETQCPRPLHCGYWVNPSGHSMTDSNELLDIAGAAAFLNVSETSLRRWTNSGRLACLRVGLKRERRFRRADLLAFMEDEPRVEASGPENSPQSEASGANTSNRGRHLCGVY